MPGIEFVGSEADGEATEEVLDTGPPRRLPPWAYAVAVLVVAAVIAGALVSQRSHGSDAGPTVSASTSLAPLVPAVPEPQVEALTSDGTSLFWVAGNRLYRGGTDGQPVVSTAISPTGGDFAELQLVADPDDDTIWVVSHGSSDSSGGAGNLEGFSTGDLDRVVRASARSLIGGAAVLEGALYVLSAGQLLRITAESKQLTPVARVNVHAADLVATSQGLVFLESGDAASYRLGTWTPNGVRTGPVLAVTDPTIAFSGGDVWVAGQRGSHPRLTHTAIARGSPEHAVATGYTDHLQIVAAGTKSIIILGSGPGPLELQCIDDATARVAVRTVAHSGLVTILDGIVYEALGGGVQQADLAGCPS